jgi:SAM-dependent methyltransferase
MLLWATRRYTEFYDLQAVKAKEWIGSPVGSVGSVLDLGCGQGALGRAYGPHTWYADKERSDLIPKTNFARVDLDLPSSEWGISGFGLVLCSNVLEHLRHRKQFLEGLWRVGRPGGAIFLSFTPWLSPWGGHEFSPWHYFGKTAGANHQLGHNLFKTGVAQVLSEIRQCGRYEVLKVAPRFYPEFAAIARVPILREFATWNLAVLLRVGDRS